MITRKIKRPKGEERRKQKVFKNSPHLSHRVRLGSSHMWCRRQTCPGSAPRTWWCRRSRRRCGRWVRVRAPRGGSAGAALTWPGHASPPAKKIYIETMGVTKTCRLSWLTNSTLVYEPKCGGGGSCLVSANEYSCTHGAQINFGDLNSIFNRNSLKPVRL